MLSSRFGITLIKFRLDLRFLLLFQAILSICVSLCYVSPAYADTNISVTGLGGCVILADKSISCWGIDNSFKSPQGEFLKVASVNNTGGACGLRTDKSISCWNDPLENIPTPKGTFVDFSSSNGSVCAIRSQDSKVICWDNKGNLYSTVSDLTFTKLAKDSNPTRGCGILSSNSNIACWGDIKISAELNKDTYSQVFFYGEEVAFYKSDGTMGSYSSSATVSGLSSKGRYIFTDGSHYLGDILPNTFSQISTFRNTVCGIRTDGAVNGLVSCYTIGHASLDKPALVKPIDGPAPASYKEISITSSNGASGCGIKLDNSITCWGYLANSKYPTNLIVNKPPTASFTADKTTGFAPLTVQLDASASKDTDGTIKEYLWSNDAGVTISNTVKPSITLSKEGTYTVKLVVKDDRGSSSTEFTQQIVVKKNSNPVAAFTMNGKGENDSWSVPYDQNGIASVQLDASNSTDDNGIKTYSWKVSNYETKEIISELKGVKPDKLTFKTLITDNYLIQLTVQDEQGLSSVLSKRIAFFNDAPLVKFTASPTTGTAPLTVQVDASASTDTQGIQGYIWQVFIGAIYYANEATASFNIGNSAKETIKFDKPGQYTIKLTAKDKMGTSSEQSGLNDLNKIISINVQNSQPTAVIKATPITGKAPLTVTLDASDSNDTDGKIQKYEWSIAENYMVIDNSVKPKSITLEKEGTYTVKLKVTDDSNVSSETTQKITVQAKDSKRPVAKISTTRNTSTQGNATLNVTLTGGQSTDVDNDIDKYEWSVSDGRKNQSGVEVPFVFDRVGTYTVTLTVTDKTGLADSTSITVTVTDGCVATYRPESRENHLQIPCVVVSGNPLIGSGYEVNLQQRNILQSFLFDLQKMPDVIPKTVPDSKCTALYYPNDLSVHVPCVRYLDKVYDVYLVYPKSNIQGNGSVLTFDLDLTRIGMKNP